MEMGIAVIEYSADPARHDEVTRRLLEEVVTEARRTPGYRGWLTAELGDGKRRDIWLFESVEALQGMATLGQLAQQHIVPLTGDPDRMLSGRVMASDGILAAILTT